jgi:signal peptidase I
MKMPPNQALRTGEVMVIWSGLGFLVAVITFGMCLLLNFVLDAQIGDVTYEVAFDPWPKSPPPDASVTVPPDRFFVMGDNRLKAVDSRYFGPIAVSSIIGKKL